MSAGGYPSRKGHVFERGPFWKEVLKKVYRFTTRWVITLSAVFTRKRYTPLS